MSAAVPPRVALVTGASQGLGSAIARALHNGGCLVAVTDIDLDSARRLAKMLDPSGTTTIPLVLDVRKQAAHEAALAAVVARWGRVDVLVNNAVITDIKPVLEITADDFDRVYAVNVRGTFIGCQVFARHMKVLGGGRIVNIASLAGQNGGAATGAHYAASKGAVLTLTKVFARDLAAFGITVNAVAPGPLDLPSVHAMMSAEKLVAMKATIPVARLGSPAFVASVVAQLAAPDADFVTGAAWDINGGLFMR